MKPTSVGVRPGHEYVWKMLTDYDVQSGLKSLACRTQSMDSPPHLVLPASPDSFLELLAPPSALAALGASSPFLALLTLDPVFGNVDT